MGLSAFNRHRSSGLAAHNRKRENGGPYVAEPDDLESLTVPQLQALAAEHGMKTAGMRKAQLIETIQKRGK